jgi:hypothetical protein
MSTLQNIGIFLAAIGGIITICKFIQEQSDRRRKKAKEAEDATFEEWAAAYEMSLGGGDGRRVLQVSDEEMRYAARAVREGRLAWSGFPRMIELAQRS